MNTLSFFSAAGPLIPYGLPCVRELFRFLVSLTNPLDRHNSDVMIHMGLSLLTVALESGADHIPASSSLMCLVRDDMCKNLIFVSAGTTLKHQRKILALLQRFYRILAVIYNWSFVLAVTAVTQYLVLLLRPGVNVAAVC